MGAGSEEPNSPTTVPEVKECDWAHFVNRFSPREPIYAIEILVAGLKLGMEVADEERKREHYDGFRLGFSPGNQWVHKIEANDTWIQRVRIQSKALLRIFSKVTGYEWGTNPHTFVRPFQYLIRYHERFKEELRRMDSEMSLTQETHGSDGAVVAAVQLKAEPREARIPPAGTLDSAGEAQSPPAPADKDGQVHETDPTALEDLRCYIKFVEERILPELKRYREVSNSTRLKIRFDDLWYLFRSGDLIFVTKKALAKATEGRIQR